MSEIIKISRIKISPLKISIVMLCLLAVVTTVAIGWGERYRIHHKWTVTVETPQGLVSGQSVLAFAYNDLPEAIFSDGSGGGYWIDGEVPIVDLENGKFLSLLTLYDPGIPMQAYAKKYQHRLQENDFYYPQLLELMAADNEPVELDSEDYPVMLVFSDKNRADSFIETREGKTMPPTILLIGA